MAEASFREIARAAGRSKNAVQNYLESPATHRVKKGPSGPRKTTPKLKRRTLRAASDGYASSNSLRQSLNLPVLSSTVRYALNSSEKVQVK